MESPPISRRAMLRAGLVWSGATLAGGASVLVERLLAQSACESSLPGELIGLVPLHGDGAGAVPFGEMLGGPGLDARLFTDLSTLQSGRLITPANEMFVRTAAPRALRPTPAAWSIAARGLRAPDGRAVSLEALRQQARPMGAHLIECSGNTDPNNFGLMSVTEWDGVPLADVVARVTERESDRQRSEAGGVLVSGVDEAQDSRSSKAGASWIFPLASLEKLGAFLAVRLNGEALTPDHGAPVRLVVPGWYGCSWIKWVNELRIVGPDQPATSQMIEFSARTHQPHVPKLARDYEPPVIDLAATPIRVEKRRVDNRIEYRVVGIVWGGDRPIDRLAIRFNPGEQPKPFPICPRPTTHRTWSLWEYRWRPEAPGIYNIALRAADPSIRTRRLDISFYVRRVVIDDV